MALLKLREEVFAFSIKHKYPRGQKMHRKLPYYSIVIPTWGFLHIPRKGIFQALDNKGLGDRELRQLQYNLIDINTSGKFLKFIASMEVDMLPGYRRHLFQ